MTRYPCFHLFLIFDVKVSSSRGFLLVQFRNVSFDLVNQILCRLRSVRSHRLYDGLVVDVEVDEVAYAVDFLG